MLAVLTGTVMIVIGNNIALSLGMVGALSIVRFRTAIKEPMDIAFLFWSIAAGIVLAAGLIPLAVLGSLFVGAVLLVFSRQKNGESPYILVVRCASPREEEQVRALVEARVRRLNLKSKLCQILGFTSLIKGGQIASAQFECTDPEDESRLFRFNLFGEK